jgi:hypothetical protein
MKIRSIGTVVVVLVLFAGIASADQLLLSQAGLDTCVDQPIAGYSLGCNLAVNQTKVITPHPAWVQSVPPLGANGNPPQWISYAHTGYGDTEFQPYGGNTLANVVFSVIQPILPGMTAFHLQVWADDTAGVYLDDVAIAGVDINGNPLSNTNGPNFTQSTCANGAIGCEAPEYGLFNMSGLSPAGHTLRIDVYQVGTGGDNKANPMGLLYTGYAVPEPASIVLLGTLFFGAGLLAKRLRRA